MRTLLHRERMLLQLAKDEGVDRARLVKLAFLLAKDTDQAPDSFYSFVPYNHGPFSFTLYHELRKLEDEGLITTDARRVYVTERGLAASETCQRSHTRICSDISKFWENRSTNELIDNVYARFPWFSMLTERKGKTRHPRPVAKLAVYTSGYEKLHVEEFFAQLLEEGVQCVIDTRSNPVSRRYGFHGRTLDGIGKRLGFEMAAEASLGIPSRWRRNLSSQEDYEALFERYDNEILPNRSDAIDRVIQRVTTQPTVLICSEQDHFSCHRSRLAKVIASRTGLPIQELRDCCGANAAAMN